VITKRWDSSDTVAIIGTGASLKQEDIDALFGAGHVIVVNDAHLLCPWADILYAADRAWWQHHSYVQEFAGERWTQNRTHKAWPTEAADAGLNVVVSRGGTHISLDPTYITAGSNSGFQALNLAVLFGAKEILLLGIDCSIVNGKSHWFGDHPGKLNRKSPYNIFRQAFIDSAPLLTACGVKVINCSELSPLPCFEKMSVTEALK